MAEIVNLRRARKEKDRRERAAAADANRLAFGRPKAERALVAASERLERERLEAHRLEGAATTHERDA
jgi:hypothetical protein